MSRHSSSVMPSVRAEFHSSLAFSNVSMMGIAAGVTNSFRQRLSFSSAKRQAFDIFVAIRHLSLPQRVVYDYYYQLGREYLKDRG